MTRRLVPACVGLSGGFLMLGYGLGRMGPGAALVAGLVALWLAGWWRRWAWAPNVGLVSLVAAAAGGVLLGLGAGWMLVGLVAALCAWDLEHWSRRLDGMNWRDERAAQRRSLERAHFRRLLAVAGLGLLLPAIALQVRVRLVFLPAVLLGLLVVWGLSRAIAFLHRESA